MGGWRSRDNAGRVDSQSSRTANKVARTSDSRLISSLSERRLVPRSKTSNIIKVRCGKVVATVINSGNLRLAPLSTGNRAMHIRTGSRIASRCITVNSVISAVHWLTNGPSNIARPAAGRVEIRVISRSFDSGAKSFQVTTNRGLERGHRGALPPKTRFPG